MKIPKEYIISGMNLLRIQLEEEQMDNPEPTFMVYTMGALAALEAIDGIIKGYRMKPTYKDEEEGE